MSSSRSNFYRDRGEEDGGRPSKILKESSDRNEEEEEIEVADLLTRATVNSSDAAKLKMLRRITEIIVHRQPALLDNFLDEMLNFQSDNSLDVRMYLIDFLQQACDADPEIIPKVAGNISGMLTDRCIQLQKRTIQAMAGIYYSVLKWISRARVATEEMEESWNAVVELKKHILTLIDSDDDGIRTHSVKFMEVLILLQTPSENDSLYPSEFCLDQIPMTMKFARPRKLEEDAKYLFEELLKFHGSRHATSVNLMACMGSICLIAKLRPSFMGKVITALEKLNAILPPTLEKSQVASVRKHMKMQLMGMIKHPRASNFYDAMTTLLTVLGASNSELQRAVPNWDEIRAEKRKRQRAQQEEEVINRKRAKLEAAQKKKNEAMFEYYDYDEDTDKPAVVVQESTEAPLDDLEAAVFKALNQPNTVELVMASLDNLPEELPAHFQSSFTPIAISGTENQIKHVSRLLAAQLVAHQSGPAAALQTTRDSGPSKIPSLAPSQPQVQIVLPVPAPVVPAPRMITKSIKLSEVTKPLNDDEKQKQLNGALERILDNNMPISPSQAKLAASIAVNSSFGPRFAVMQFINRNIHERIDFGIQWIFAEYSSWQGYLAKSVQEETSADRYQWTFYNLMKGILDFAHESEKGTLAWKLYTEPPVIPEQGIQQLKTLCALPHHCEKGMQLVLELANKRTKSSAVNFLNILLDFSVHAVDDIRDQAVKAVLQMYDADASYKKVIEEQAIGLYLKSLSSPHPPETLFKEELGRKEVFNEWSENTIKASIQLYFELLGIHHGLLPQLASVYVEATSDVKRVVLRYVDIPIRKLGIESPEVLNLLDTFPKGAETLITRILHILTEKSAPTQRLVDSVRNIYAKRVGDVRFLIPVLSGLGKQDIVAALPKLIKLNPNVVKEVFNRLLGIDSKTTQNSPITPVDLMVALHTIDFSKCDMKTVIKATSICFSETEVFTADTLAVIINQLVELVPLPTLLMRTVLQSLALHPRLSGFIVNTLTKLLSKQVWTQPKIWEGVIKCCQRLVPHSVPVLLSLNPDLLRDVLNKDAPDLRPPLIDYLMSLSDQQRSCFRSSALDVIFNREEHPLGGYGYDSNGMPRRPSVKDERRSPPPEIAMKQEYFENHH